MDRTDAARIGLLDLPNWWGERGRPGWVPDADQMGGFPWVLAGHARAGWRIEEPGRAPQAQPFPGVHLSQTPFAYFDSVNAGPPDALRASGLDHALLTAYGRPAPATQKRARAVVSLGAGALARDDNSLAFARGDSAGWLRLETSSGSRGGYGGWQSVNRHRWGFGGGIDNGSHVLEGAYAQRGGAARLSGGEQHSASGETGYARYMHRSRGGWSASMRASRGYDQHDSYGGPWAYSHRDAQENRLLGRLLTERSGSRYVFSLEWRRARTVRSFDGAFEKNASAVWGEIDWSAPVGDGRLLVKLGGGDRPGVQGFRMAPSVQYMFAASAWSGRVAVERLLESVAADLAPGQAPFLQDTWIGTLEVGAGSAPTAGVTGTGVQLGFHVGQTTDRAVVKRLPVEDLWLRSGFVADPDRYAFGLLTARASWTGRTFGAGLEGFTMARDQAGVQPRVDPAQGGRAFVQSSFDMFAGDLNIVLRAEAEGIGARESEAAVPRDLDGYVTFAVSGAFTLADAILVLSLRNLQDVQHEQVWIDTATGMEALGPGREWRLRLTWMLFG